MIQQINCPFCKELSISADYQASYVGSTIQRISNKKSITNFIVPEKYIILSGCDKCKKCKNDIKDAFEHGIKRETRKDKLDRFKKQELPLVIHGNK